MFSLSGDQRALHLEYRRHRKMCIRGRHYYYWFTKFEEGHRKIGGRKKGTPNKITLIRADDLLLKLDVNPIQKLIEIAESDEASIDPGYYTNLRAHETKAKIVCSLLLEKKKKKNKNTNYILRP